MSQINNPSLIDTLLRLFSEKKITRDNAFCLDLVVAAEHAITLARGKNGFTEAGTHVAAMENVYSKRVEYTAALAEQLLGKFIGVVKPNAGRGGHEDGDEPQQKQRRRRKERNADSDVDVRLCTNEELSLPRDGRSCVLNNFLLEDNKERDGKIRESCVPNILEYTGNCIVRFLYKCPMYCGLVVNDAQPHQLFEEYVERPADPSLDLSGMLPALRDTVASIEALGDNPFPELKKLLVKDPHPLATALNELLLDMPVSVQCDPMPGTPRPPTIAKRSQHTPAEPQAPCSSAGPSAAEADSSRLSSGTAAAPDDTSEQQPQHQSPAEPLGDGFDATQVVPDSQPAAVAGGWDDDGFDGGFDGFDGGHDWENEPLDSGADLSRAGTDGAPGDMSQAMQWLMQPQRADFPQVNLSWADKTAWRFGQPPRESSTTSKTGKKAAPAKAKKLTSKCTGPDDEEHFPSCKPGKTYQLSAKKQEEIKQRAERVQRDAKAQRDAPPPRIKQPAEINFEERYNAITTMLADLNRPAESKRNQRAAIEDGDLDVAALWAEDDSGDMHDDNHAATGGYCDYDAGGDNWGDDGYEDWSAGPANDATNASGLSAGDGGTGAQSHWGALSPLAQNLAPVVAHKGAAKINYARRRKPADPGKLKTCLWDSFLQHRTKQCADPAELPSTQLDNFTQPQLAPEAADVSPKDINWQEMLNDIQVDASWEGASVHMCCFLTLVLCNERSLRMWDAGSIEGGHRIMLRQDVQ